MSDNAPQGYDDDDPTIADLRARADRGAAFEAENKVQGAELKVLRAGVPIVTKADEAFVRDLATRTDVDLNDRDAIHKAAREWGVFGTEGGEAKDIPADQQGLANARQGIQGGTAPDAAPPPPPDAVDEGWANFKTRVYEKGARREDAAAEVIDRIVTGAVNGDERCRVAVNGSPFGAMQRRYEDRDVPFVPGRSA